MSYASLVSTWRIQAPRVIRSLTCGSPRRSSQSPFETRRSTKGCPLPLSLSPPSPRLPFSPVRRWFPRPAHISSPKRRPLPPRKRSPPSRKRRANRRLGVSRPGSNSARLRPPKWNGPPRLHPQRPPLAEAHTYLQHLQALSPRHLPQQIHQRGMQRRNIRLVLTSSFKDSACKRRRNFTSH